MRLFPLEWAGAYAGLGLATRTAPYDAGVAARGGLIGEVPLTNTIALEPHGGCTYLATPDGASRPFAELGLSIVLYRLGD